MYILLREEMFQLYLLHTVCSYPSWKWSQFGSSLYVYIYNCGEYK